MSEVSLEQTFALPGEERVVQQIWDSVFEHPEDLSVTAAQREELERRWEAFQQNPDEGEPWEDVRKSLFGR
jgi:putative addiction module component (TIGR02574 family)